MWKKDLHLSNETLLRMRGQSLQMVMIIFVCKENFFLSIPMGKNIRWTKHKAVCMVVLEMKSELNDRLKSLEVDHDFLEGSLNSLQNGNEGLQFVQEIAHQLQELRKIGIGFRCQSVP
jgi:1-aminocyclopropane-1-carboxylate deaminase/D-cysteine desulfhydrase-like pyridoxal-dependent ACC family enzyme